MYCNDLSLGCNLGLYGTDCDMNCPINCKDQMCDIVNGTCFGCEFGWTGDTCKQGYAPFENFFFINIKIIKIFLIEKKNEMHLIPFCILQQNVLMAGMA